MATSTKTEKKFTEDEMKELGGIQETYIQIQSQMGQVRVSKIRLNAQVDDLDRFDETLEQQFLDTSKKEKEFVDSITEKYGNGSFDPETGIFTANK